MPSSSSAPTAGTVDPQALIEFNKYTLALAAAGFVYTIEKFTPAASADGRIFALSLLLLFFLSVLAGVVVFAVATKATYGKEVGSTQLAFIRYAGTSHAVLLAVAVAVLGAGIVHRVVVTVPTAPCASECALPAACPTDSKASDVALGQ